MKKPPSGFPSFSNTEEDIIEALNTPNFETRLRTLNHIRAVIQENPQWFHRFRRKLELFDALSNTLADSNWEIQHQCVKFLAEAVIDLGEDIDWCVAILLPVLIPKLASQKLTIRRVTVLCLSNYLTVTRQTENFLKVLNKFGLQDASVCNEVLKEMSNLLNSAQLASLDWSALVPLLTALMTSPNSSRDALIVELLERLMRLVGQAEFNEIVHGLPNDQRLAYSRSLAGQQLSTSSKALPLLHFPFSTAIKSKQQQQQPLLRYGIIPMTVYEKIVVLNDPPLRLNGLQQLKIILENMREADFENLWPHFDDYFNMINSLLDDQNYKIVAVSLDVLRLTVVNMSSERLQQHLVVLVNLICKQLGTQKTVIKQINMMLLMDLMQSASLKTTVESMNQYLKHRSSRVREEVICIFTAALLRFPSSEFNLAALVEIVVPLLIDPKRRVRHASFELISVLAQALGATRLENLINYIKGFERSTPTAEGLTSAVQTRLARHQLPRIKYDGLLEYAVSVGPSPELQRMGAVVTTNSPLAADLDWIANSSPHFNVSRSLSPQFSQNRPGATAVDGGAAASVMQTSIQQIAQESVAVRRVFSAGRSRRKLPWEQTNASWLLNERAANWSAPVRTGEIYQVPDTPQAFDAPTIWKSFDPTSLAHNAEDFPKSISQGKRVLSPISQQPSNAFKATSDGSNDDQLADYAQVRRYQNQSVLKKSLSLESVSSPTRAKFAWDDTPVGGKAASGHQLSNGMHFPGDAEPAATSTTAMRAGRNAVVVSKSLPSKKPAVNARPSLTASQRIKLSNKSVASKGRHLSGSDEAVANASPAQRISSALKKLTNEDWQVKVNGISSIQSLLKENPGAIEANLQEICTALMAEAKNLRSSVSRQAFLCISDLFASLGKAMDPQVDRVCLVLMVKTGDTSAAFIRDDAMRALETVVQYASPQKTLNAILSTGANHKSVSVRAACAQLLNRLVGVMGSSAVLHEFPERVLSAAVHFATDQTPIPRQHGRSILFKLCNQPNFSASVKTHLNETHQRFVFNLLESAKAE